MRSGLVCICATAALGYGIINWIASHASGCFSRECHVVFAGGVSLLMLIASHSWSQQGVASLDSSWTAVLLFEYCLRS